MGTHVNNCDLGSHLECPVLVRQYRSDVNWSVQELIEVQQYRVFCIYGGVGRYGDEPGSPGRLI